MKRLRFTITGVVRPTVNQDEGSLAELLYSSVVHSISEDYKLPDDDINVDVAIVQDADPFPNGFASWQETHFEVVSHLAITSDVEGSLSHQRQAESGTGGLYQLAEEITNKFENAHIGVEWDGDYFDTIEQFLEDLEKGELSL